MTLGQTCNATTCLLACHGSLTVSQCITREPVYCHNEATISPLGDWHPWPQCLSMHLCRDSSSAKKLMSWAPTKWSCMAQTASSLHVHMPTDDDSMYCKYEGEEAVWATWDCPQSGLDRLCRGMFSGLLCSWCNGTAVGRLAPTHLLIRGRNSHMCDYHYTCFAPICINLFPLRLAPTYKSLHVYLYTGWT